MEVADSDRQQDTVHVRAYQDIDRFTGHSCYTRLGIIVRNRRKPVWGK